MSMFETKAYANFQAKLEAISISAIIMGCLFVFLEYQKRFPESGIGITTLTIGGILYALAVVLRGYKYVHGEPDWTLVYPELAMGESNLADEKYFNSENQKLQELKKELELLKNEVEQLNTKSHE